MHVNSLQQFVNLGATWVHMWYCSKTTQWWSWLQPESPGVVEWLAPLRENSPCPTPGGALWQVGTLTTILVRMAQGGKLWHQHDISWFGIPTTLPRSLPGMKRHEATSTKPVLSLLSLDALLSLVMPPEWAPGAFRWNLLQWNAHCVHTGWPDLTMSYTCVTLTPTDLACLF